MSDVQAAIIVIQASAATLGALTWSFIQDHDAPPGTKPIQYVGTALQGIGIGFFWFLTLPFIGIKALIAARAKRG